MCREAKECMIFFFFYWFLVVKRVNVYARESDGARERNKSTKHGWKEREREKLLYRRPTTKVKTGLDFGVGLGLVLLKK